MRDLKYAVLKALLPQIILSELSAEPRHGYAIITTIRKKRHVYFGPSTIYPLLGELQRDGLVTSRWSIAGERPRKTYEITQKGQAFLMQTEVTLRAEQIVEARVK